MNYEPAQRRGGQHGSCKSASVRSGRSPSASVRHGSPRHAAAGSPIALFQVPPDPGPVEARDIDQETYEA